MVRVAAKSCWGKKKSSIVTYFSSVQNDHILTLMLRFKAVLDGYLFPL